MYRLFFLAFISFSFINLFSQDIIEDNSSNIDLITNFYSEESNHWADSLLSNMTLEEKIAQLFVVAAYSNKDKKHVDDITDLISKFKVGGIMFMQGGPVRQANLTNIYQSFSKIPLMIAQDSEWGLSMRLDSTYRFPWQMTLGSIKDEKLVYDLGSEIARQCKLIGVNINFAPVLDVNFNSENPIIGNRSFGEDPIRVSELGYQFMKGMQDNNVLACGKHFPGHGDTYEDSHKTLPTINHSRKRLDSVELYPFRTLINDIGSIMIAHLNVPSLDKSKDLSVSLSKKVVTNLLKDQYGYNGLIITDALNMKGVSSYYDPGLLEVKALLAGNDILLFSQDVPKAISEIKNAIDKKIIDEKEIEARCRKILNFKYWMGLNDFKPLKLQKIKQELNNQKSILLNRKLFENSVTLLQNYNSIIPLKRLDTLKIASLAIGDKFNSFQATLSKYADIDSYSISIDINYIDRIKMLKKLSKYNLVIVSIHMPDNNPWRNHKIKKNIDLFIQKISTQSKLIVDVFANPYSINSFLFTHNFDGLLLSYQNHDISQETSAQAIFGGIPINGQIPVSTNNYKLYSGLQTDKVRLGFSLPEEFAVSDSQLFIIDSLVNNAIIEKSTPGCQILFAKNGKVIFNKSYGYQTYDKKIKVKNSDIYDIASITKIMSTVPILMKMNDDNLINIEHKISDYIDLDSSEIKNLTIKEVLAHQSGLIPWIPFYKFTMEKDSNNDGFFKLRDTLYSDTKDLIYSLKICDSMFLHFSYTDTIFKLIKNSEIFEDNEYRYSDLGYYIFQKIIEKVYSKKIDKLVDEFYFKKLGMENLGYLPLNKFSKTRIVPTEMDYFYRGQLIHGYVHDMGAAMFGGVSGHAGLFSNSNDLAKMMQMYLNNGIYGDERYISDSTLIKFTQRQYLDGDNRRGAGFDKPSIDEGGPTSKNVPMVSFGHTGFTGTIAWADPQNDIIFIFLSNRIHPDMENKKLLTLNVRTNIMEQFYKLFTIE